MNQLQQKKYIGIVILCLWVVNAAAQLNWKQVFSGTTSNLLCVNRCDDRYIAVGENGTIITSDDGALWSVARSTVKDILRNVCLGENGYVAVGDNGTILRSDDSRTWTKQESGTDLILTNLLCGNGVYITSARENRGVVYRSTDAINWEAVTIAGAEYSSFDAAAYAQGLFVICGINGDPSGPVTGTPEAYISEDGSTWNVYPMNCDTAAKIKTLLWTGNEFMAFSYKLKPQPMVCGVHLSPNAKTWTYQIIPPSSAFTPIRCKTMALGAAGYIGVGSDNKMIHSPDGIQWKSITTTIPHQTESIIWDGKSYFAAGTLGEIFISYPDNQVALAGLTSIHMVHGHAPEPALQPLFNLRGQRCMVIAGNRHSLKNIHSRLPVGIADGFYLLPFVSSGRATRVESNYSTAAHILCNVSVTR